MGPKRTMLRIDRGGDRRLHAILARFFSAPVRSIVENATLVGIRKEHGFPQVFGKASQKTLGFPTFFTTPTARTITHQFEAVGIQLRLADFLSKEWGDPPLSTWRRQREAGELAGLRPAKRGRKGKPEDARDKRIAELERKNRRLEAKLEQAQTVIAIQKKVASLLGIPLKSADEEEND